MKGKIAIEEAITMPELVYQVRSLNLFLTKIGSELCLTGRSGLPRGMETRKPFA
jgi:hypothetical protein